MCFTGDALTFSAENAVEGYAAAKAVLSEADWFEDLILDKGFSDVQLFDCGAQQPQAVFVTGEWDGVTVENASNTEHYHNTEIFFSDIANSGNVHLVEGNWIDVEKPGQKGDPLQLLVCDESIYALNQLLWVDLGLYEADGQRRLLPAVVVGKVKNYEPIPHAGKQTNLFAFDKAEGTMFIENPLNRYDFVNFSGESPKSDYYNEGVTFRVERNAEVEPIAYKALVQRAAEASNGAIYINYGYNANVQSMANEPANQKILILAAMNFLFVFIFLILCICKIVKRCKEGKVC